MLTVQGLRWCLGDKEICGGVRVSEMGSFVQIGQGLESLPYGNWEVCQDPVIPLLLPLRGRTFEFSTFHHPILPSETDVLSCKDIKTCVSCMITQGFDFYFTLSLENLAPLLLY